MGFLCCRNFQDRARFVESCRDTFVDDRGLIIPLDDQTVLRLLSCIRNDRRADIDNQLSELVAEIWAG
jgi:hypothetical protein